MTSSVDEGPKPSQLSLDTRPIAMGHCSVMTRGALPWNRKAERHLQETDETKRNHAKSPPYSNVIHRGQRSSWLCRPSTPPDRTCAPWEPSTGGWGTDTSATCITRCAQRSIISRVWNFQIGRGRRLFKSGC